MAVTTAKLAQYLRFPPDNHDELEPYLLTAFARADATGVPRFSNNALYDMFILKLSCAEYDNRGMTFNTAVDATAFTNLMNTFVLQLRYANEDAEVPGNGSDEAIYAALDRYFRDNKLTLESGTE